MSSSGDNNSHDSEEGSASSDNDSYDSDEGSSIHNESSVDGGFLDFFHGDSDDDSESVDDAINENDYEIIREGELHLVSENIQDKTTLFVKTAADSIPESWAEQNWEALGRDIMDNEHLLDLYFTLSINYIEGSAHSGVLSDENMISIFKGLTRSNTIRSLKLCRNRFGVRGIQAMVPFLMNSSNLGSLNLSRNNIQSEGFNNVFRALRDSPIVMLSCGWCGVENLEIDSDHIPKRLQYVSLVGNNINSEGCRELTKLLLKEDGIVEMLGLKENNIDDEGVEILVDALRENTSLKVITLDANEGITMKGKSLMLKLVNDISSIDATLQSNHTLTTFGQSFVEGIDFVGMFGNNSPNHLIHREINIALQTNITSQTETDIAAAAGRKKVISTQLSSRERTLLCHLQDVDVCNEALFSEINPLHLPEVLALVGRYHGQSELYVALVSSIAGLFSTINRKKFLQERVEYHLSIIKDHAATVETLRNEITAIEEAEGTKAEMKNGFESLGDKRRRT